MKAVYYYSEQQEQIAIKSKLYEHHTPTIGGMKYTEV